MPLEKHYSLSTAARLVGVDRRALKRWLRQDLGIVLPRVRHGAKVMIRERDLEKIIANRRSAVEAVSR